MQDKEYSVVIGPKSRKWPTFDSICWILWGIILPAAAIITEKITEVCARTFFDPTPTDWHLVLISLVPLTNLVGVLLARPTFAKHFGWLNSPPLLWINGIAIGVSGFYAVWFLPLSLMSVIFLALGGFSVICWYVAGIPMAFTHPNQLFSEHGAMIWGPPLAAVTCGAILLLPLAPLMSCLACLRMRGKLIAQSSVHDKRSDKETESSSPVGRKPNWASIVAGLVFYPTVAFATVKYWEMTHIVPFAAYSQASVVAVIGTILPSLLIVLAILLPTALSPMRWITVGSGEKKGSGTKDRILLPIACGLLALVLIEVPSTATRVAMGMTTDPKTRAQGLLLLRAFANDDSLLRMCYEKTHSTDIIGTILTWGKPVSSKDARQMYYRVTGRPFNSRNIPASFRGKIRDFADWSGDADDVFDSDAEQAGETVGGVVRGVTLAHSEIGANIDQCGTAAQVNWDMQFKNESQYQREARAQILLPPNAVVSNVFLWINGKPHPASFGSRGATRAAYQAVVRRRRDPLLVTTYGPDRILAQCFPVPPKGTMHIQFAMTVPLAVQSEKEAYLAMPILLERNFQVEKHLIKIGGKALMSNPGNVLKLDKHELAGEVSNQDLSACKATILAQRNIDCNRIWCPDTSHGDTYISLLVSPMPQKKPKQLVVVVDGSQAMAGDVDRIASLLQKIPDGIKLDLIRAGDAVEPIASNVAGVSDPAWRQALETLKQQTFVGGQDDTSALIQTLEFVKNHADSAVLWLHGPQPVEFDSSRVLGTRLAEQPNLTLYELQMENGPNRIIESLDGIANVKRLAILTSVDATLDRLFASWKGDAVDYQSALTHEDMLGLPLAECVVEKDVDLTPLWANQTINALRQSKIATDLKQAVAMATRYRVVTPVSGAVVLETDKDYQKYGLQAPSSQQPVQKTGPFSGLMSALGKPMNSAELEQSYPQPESSAPPVSHFGPLDPPLFGEMAAPEPEDWLYYISLGAFGLVLMRKRWLPCKQHES